MERLLKRIREVRGRVSNTTRIRLDGTPLQLTESNKTLRGSGSVPGGYRVDGQHGVARRSSTRLRLSKN